MPEPYTVVDVIVNSDVHNLLEAAVIEADLCWTPFPVKVPFTVFAPPMMPSSPRWPTRRYAEDLLALPEPRRHPALPRIGAQVLSTDLSDGATATTFSVRDVTVTIECDGIFINDAQVTVADIVTDNGVVHVIDAVLLPPDTRERMRRRRLLR